MPDFTPVIGDAYREILTREPDASGASFYNQRMNDGMSEEDLRETLLRSPEYENKHPGFRPLVIHGRFNFDWYGYTSFGLLGRSLDERMVWVERGLNEGIRVFRVGASAVGQDGLVCWKRYARSWSGWRPRIQPGAIREFAALFETSAMTSAATP